MSKICDIIGKYTAGEVDVETTNRALINAGYEGILLVPGKNTLTEEEKRATTIGYYPDQANGWGLLASGTGTFDKVEVRNGKLVGCDMGDSYAMYLIAGHQYYVHGDMINDEKPEETEAKVLPARPNTKRDASKANTVERQETKRGFYDVYYDDNGYVKKAIRVKVD